MEDGSLIRGPSPLPYHPLGSKYPTFEVSGPKEHALNGFGDQRP